MPLHVTRTPHASSAQSPAHGLTNRPNNSYQPRPCRNTAVMTKCRACTKMPKPSLYQPCQPRCTQPNPRPLFPPLNPVAGVLLARHVDTKPHCICNALLKPIIWYNPVQPGKGLPEPSNPPLPRPSPSPQENPGSPLQLPTNADKQSQATGVLARGRRKPAAAAAAAGKIQVQSAYTWGHGLMCVCFNNTSYPSEHTAPAAHQDTS
jgi:hypothetical protein